MDIVDVYIGCGEPLGEQAQAIYDYCQENCYPKQGNPVDHIVLSALGSLLENIH